MPKTMHKSGGNIINILLWIPLLIFVAPWIFLFWLWNVIFEFLVTKIFRRNDLRSPNNIMDMTMCQGNSYDLPNTNAAHIWVVSGDWISAEEFSVHFHRCFLEGNPEKYRNLYAHVNTCGSYAFFAHCKPEQLDLKWHIREYTIGEYGNGTLESWAVTWMTTNTYEEGRPVWQIALLHLGCKEDGTMETGIVAKFSHSLVDGYSFIHMIGKLTDNPAPYLVKEETYTWKDKIKHVFHAPKDVCSVYGDVAFSRNSKSQFRLQPSTNSGKSQQWKMSFASLDLSSVKLIRKATDSHFICLMISAQFGALRRFLLETKDEDELPEYLWMGSSLPWPKHPFSFTNHWTVGYFKCPVALSDPLERLRSVEAYYRYFKRKECDVKGMFTMGAVLRLLPAWGRKLFYHYDLALRNVSFFFASLLFSPKKHYLLGRPVKNLYLPLACCDVIPVSLYGVTSSHSGQIDLAITACNTVVTNQEELDRLTRIYFIEELDSIASQCGLNCTAALASNTKC